MRGHGVHMWMCAAAVVVALAALTVSGSALYLVPALGCLAMMAAMMYLMSHHGGGSGSSDGR